jgi:serine phosphatase RsbU (regulator of sigma subunit)
VDGEPRSEAAVDVPAGAMLVWYSDGLVERRDSDLDHGLERLADVTAGLQPPDPGLWCDVVMQELTGDQRLHDDVVLLCLRLDGDPAVVPAPARAREDWPLRLQA